MSHFSTIQTKLKDRSNLLKALQNLSIEILEDVELDNPLGHNHPKVHADISINDTSGFIWNKTNYEFITDKQTWKNSIPVERLLDKINQEYAKVSIYEIAKVEGFSISEESVKDDGSLEFVCTRWN